MSFVCSRRSLNGLALGGLLTVGSLSKVQAATDPVERFYKGKQITFVVSSDPGGGYDLLARLVAQRLSQFIPGHPMIVVQNMPGAGGVLASNLIYDTAPQDGTYMGLVQRGVLISQLTQQPGVHYQVAKFHWIGSVTAEDSLVVSWHTSKVKTFQDLRTHELIVGGTGATGDTEASARILNALADTKFKIVSGYPGTADVLLAVQRGELQGVADLSWTEMKSKNVDLLRAHDLNLLAQNSLDKAPDLPNVPLAIDFVVRDRPVAELYYAMKGVARPILMGPNVPPERIAAIRSAFWTMVQSPSFKQDAARAKLELTPRDYAAVEKFIQTTTTAPPQVGRRLTEILNLPH
jgi:tripartite-type tricarboxylate transporter receptor subunit TctC